MQVDFSSLSTEISKEVLHLLSPLVESLKSVKPEKNDRFISGREVENIYGISNVTRYDWEKKGILKGYKIGSRRRYRLSEVMSAPIPVETDSI